MKKNDIDDRWGTHLVRITLMDGKAVGHVTVKTEGNIKGRDVIGTAIDNLQAAEGVVKNDCFFRYDEKTDEYAIRLTVNAIGVCPTTKHEWQEIEDMIVGVEIIGFTPRKWKQDQI